MYEDDLEVYTFASNVPIQIIIRFVCANTLEIRMHPSLQRSFA